MTLKILFLIVSTILGSVIQLLASSTGNVASSLISAVVVTVISHALWRFAAAESQKPVDGVIPVGGAFLGIATGSALQLLQANFNRWTWAAVPAGLLTSAICMALGRRRPLEVCFQHRVRLTTMFLCPRCRQRFCGSSDCWDSRSARCQRCRQNEVLLLNLRDEHWWIKYFGKRVHSGNCMKCLSPAGRADVHECGQCHLQMCRRCWDLDNCQCRKCDWRPEVLPEALVILLPPQRALTRRQSRNIVVGHSSQE